MPTPPPLRQGRIVWVELLDPQGRNPKVRPAVVLTPTAEIRPGGVIQVAAVTTQAGAPTRLAVPLPWHRDGHPRTKLRRPSEVVCDWLVEVAVAAVRVTEGLVLFREMNEILSKMPRSETGPPPPPAGDPPSQPAAE